MRIAHLGASTAQQGGPAGYLAQLSRAFTTFGTGGHEIVLPPPQRTTAPTTSSPPGARLIDRLRRLRRSVVGAPAFARPSQAEIEQPGGRIGAFLATAWASMEENGRESVAAAIAGEAAVLFAHDVASAEAGLQSRRGDQQVWLFLHAPMSLVLYLSWCWGVPDRSWQEVSALPDVQAWSGRELEVLGAVDKILIPCAEAGDELVRSDSRFARVLDRAAYLMTGAEAPARVWPADTRVELRRRFRLPVDEPVALFLGSAQPYRGFDALVNALAVLPSRRRVPGVVAVAGPAIDTVPLSSRLRALGPIRQVADLLAAVDVVINVNRFSLFDLSTIEALHAGCPMVMHATGGNTTFDRLGAGCVMLPNLEPTTIADGLTRAFTLSEDERSHLAAQSRACYDAHLTLRHLRDRHVALYDKAAMSAQATVS